MLYKAIIAGRRLDCCCKSAIGCIEPLMQSHPDPTDPARGMSAHDIQQHLQPTSPGKHQHFASLLIRRLNGCFFTNPSRRAGHCPLITVGVQPRSIHPAVCTIFRMAQQHQHTLLCCTLSQIVLRFLLPSAAVVTLHGHKRQAQNTQKKPAFGQL
jgi:hypothetical protein